MHDVEDRLRMALRSGYCADEAIWMLAHQQVGQVFLCRAVASVFTLTLEDAWHAVGDAVRRQGIPPLEPPSPSAPGWPDREAGVLDALAQGSPLWSHHAPVHVAYRACFLPSWHLPLLLVVEQSSTLRFTAVTSEPFSGPDS